MANKKIYSNYDDFRELQIDGKYREETIEKALSCLKPDIRYISSEHTDSFFIPLKEGYVDFNRYSLENKGLLKNHENVNKAQEHRRRRYGDEVNKDDWIYGGNGNRIQVSGGNKFFEKLEKDLVNGTVMPDGDYRVSTKDYIGATMEYVDLEKGNLVVYPQDKQSGVGYENFLKIQAFVAGKGNLNDPYRYNNRLSMELLINPQSYKLKDISPDLKDIEYTIDFSFNINPWQPPSRERTTKLLDYIRTQGESFMVGCGGDGGGVAYSGDRGGVACYHLVL